MWGTGSGVLSITSSLLGAKESFAYDGWCSSSLAQKNVNNPGMENMHVAERFLRAWRWGGQLAITADISPSDGWYLSFEDEGYLIIVALSRTSGTWCVKWLGQLDFPLETMIQGNGAACVFKKTRILQCDWGCMQQYFVKRFCLAHLSPLRTRKPASTCSGHALKRRWWGNFGLWW